MYMKDGSSEPIDHAAPIDYGPSPKPVPLTCAFCGRSAEETILHAQFICRSCQQQLQEIQERGA